MSTRRIQKSSCSAKELLMKLGLEGFESVMSRISQPITPLVFVKKRCFGCFWLFLGT